MNLTRQSTSLAWLAALTVAAVLATTTLAMREVQEQTRQSEWAESTAQGVNGFRYLIMETALFHEPRAAAQWRTRLASFQRTLARQQYGSARENALLARERANLSVLARQYARLAEPDISAELSAATVSQLFLTSQEMIDDAAELIYQNRLDLQRAQQRAGIIVLLSVLLLAGLIAGCFSTLRRRVLAPVAALQAITERVAGGDLSLRLRLSEDNEIGQLAHSFDRMSEQLADSLARMQAEIAERQRAQEALQGSVAELAAKSGELARAQADLQTIIDHTPALVVYWDRDLRNRFANRAYQAWFGLSPEQIRGMHVRDVVGADRYADVEPMLHSVMRGNTEVFERTLRLPDGATRDMLFSYTPDIQDGEVKGFYGFISDISQLRMAQSGQAAALARLQGVVDAAIDFAIIATSMDGTIELFSRGAERLLGYRSAEVLGHANLARFHRPEDVAALGAALSQQYGRGIAGFEVFVQGARHGQSDTREWTCVRRDGVEVEVSLTVTALRDANGEPIGFLGVATDIGRDKAILRTLAAARDEAEAGSRAKTEFLANVSHEIRTPMNAILGLLQMLQQTELTERQRGYADSTRAAARSLLHILNDILDFSKVDAGKMALEHLPFGLPGLMAELAALAESLAAGKELTLHFKLDPALAPTVMGDPLRLRQVLLNLIGNAIKFTGAGEVCVEVATRGERVEFSVQDTGIGIGPEQLGGIFEVFSQAETSTTRRFGGTGLGLAISQRLVQLMGASIEVSSVPGAGSRFWFALMLPAAPSSVSPPLLPVLPVVPAPLPADGPRLPGVRLLVVDDNALNREVAEALLCAEGAEVVLADGGRAALDILRAHGAAVDLVLMDIQMPDMDGYAATGAIRADAALAQLPVVAMTANAMAGDREACLAAGMNEYLEKPIDIDTLVATVRRLHGGAAMSPAAVPAPLPAAAGAHKALQRLGGSVQLFVSVARRYPEDARAQAQALDDALAEGDHGAAARHCHSLRGVAGTIGADALVAYLATLEAGLRRDPSLLALAHERASLARLVEGSIGELAQACAALEAGRVILGS